MTETTTAPSTTSHISFDDFVKVDLRVAEILSAEPVEKSKKLLKLQLSLGAELGTRQIVAGIAKDYAPETLIGRKIVIVFNLAAATLAGVESNGMLLASTNSEGRVVPLDPGQDSVVGTRVK